MSYYKLWKYYINIIETNIMEISLKTQSKWENVFNKGFINKIKMIDVPYKIL